MDDKIEKDDLSEPVSWRDFLTLASKVKQQEELIKICFNNGEILNNRLKDIDVDIDDYHEHNKRLRELERGQ